MYFVVQGEDGPEIRGGSIDALIVHATAAGKSGDFLIFFNVYIFFL